MIGTALEQTTSGTADKLANSLAAIRDIDDLYLEENQSPIEEARTVAPDEVDRVTPKTPIFVLPVYDRAVLSGAALRAVLANQDQIVSTRHFMHELSPYAARQELHKRHKPRATSLLWASLTCFGFAGLLLVALIKELL